MFHLPPYTAGETRIGTYGDMGHSHYNAMGNLLNDCKVHIL